MLQMACYSHFAFEQEAFEKEFVLNNQKERQNAKTCCKGYLQTYEQC